MAADRDVDGGGEGPTRICPKAADATVRPHEKAPPGPEDGGEQDDHGRESFPV